MCNITIGKRGTGVAGNSKKKGAKIVYVTSEQFTNEFISAIQHGELVKFRRRFRQAELK